MLVQQSERRKRSAGKITVLTIRLVLLFLKSNKNSLTI